MKLVKIMKMELDSQSSINMNIIYTKKDISSVERGVVAHGTNCCGVMGSGVAKALRAKYPIIFNPYKLMCDSHVSSKSDLLGSVCFVDVGLETTPNNELIIANCFTQVNYGRDGRQYAHVEAIITSVEAAVKLAVELGLPFYMPKIGCGLGGLSWDDDVEMKIEEIADKYDTTIYVCDL